MAHPQNYQTYVFLDIETTGLPRDKPRMVELCLFAVHHSSLQRLPRTNEPRLPRVIDKLTLCMDPRKPFTLDSEQMTRLSNRELEQNCKQETNGTLVEILKGFLGRQAQPVCLVAHNGLGFDFPLLRKELGEVGLDLPANIGCLDTLQALKDLIQDPCASYRLADLYQYFYKQRPFGAHSAEEDVVTLLLLFLAKAPQLKEWAAKFAPRWEEIRPMYFTRFNSGRS